MNIAIIHGWSRRCVLLPVLVTALASCTAYDVSINDRLVYTPKELFSDFLLADSALQDCVAQTVEDHKATSRAQIVALNCSNAGIQILDGIDQFEGLRQLKLSVNRLSDVDVLAQLPALELLLLDENELQDVSALASLPELKKLTLTKNDNIDCAQISWLMQLRPGLTVVAPAHCDQN